MNHPVLIVGGGIGGITAALELAEAGQEVILLEKEPYLGGNVSRFHNYFPKLCPPSCGLEINFRRIRSNPRVRILTGATLIRFSGEKGSFETTVSLEAQLINDRCTACGKCAEICPEERPLQIGTASGNKAAYIREGIPFPMKYTIDEQICKKAACGKCVDVCEPRAIQLDAVPSEVGLGVSGIIIATGWHLYDAAKLENYGYGAEPDVITNLEFEYLLGEALREQRKLARPSDGKVPERIAFVQCAGSRDQRHLPYCSSVCCSATIKHVLTLAENHPGISTEVFYIDLRLTGRNEKLLRKAEQNPAISMTKGKVGRISGNVADNGLLLEVEDVMAGSRRKESFDMVVLATGLVPNQLAAGLPVGPEGFFLDGQIPGIYAAASCKRPMDVASTVRDATAAALKTLQQ